MRGRKYTDHPLRIFPGANVINKFLVQTQQTAPERLNNLNAVILFGDPNRIPSTPGNIGSALDTAPVDL